MRLAPLFAAAALSAAASATLAQTPPRMHHPARVTGVETPLAAAPGVPSAPLDTHPVVSQSQMDALIDKIAADEVTMTRLRDPELAQENARIRAIKPALSHDGGGLFVLGWLADL